MNHTELVDPREATRFSQASWAVLACSMLLVSLAVVFLLLRISQPFDDARLEPSARYWAPDGVTVQPLREQSNGLRSGDVVVAIEGRLLTSWAVDLLDPSADRPEWQFDQRVIYTIRRDGQLLDVPVRLERYPLGAVLAREWGTIAFASTFFLVAGFVFFKRPSDPAAMTLFFSASAVSSASTWSFGLQSSDLVFGTGFWLHQLTTRGVYFLFWAGMLHFALVFPQRRAFVGRHRWIVPAIYAVALIVFVGVMTINWQRSDSTFEWISQVNWSELVLPIPYLGLALVATLTGYRSTQDAIARQQMRWLVFGALITGTFGISVGFLPELFGRPLLDGNVLALVALLFPLTVAVAILRYRLFDIDVIIRRALVYSALSALLGALYVSTILLLQTLLQPVTQGSDLAVVISTLVVAAMFQPFRNRLQHFIDRRFYRRRYNTSQALDQFSYRLRHQINIDELQAEIVTVVQATMQPSHVSLWLRPFDIQPQSPGR